MTFNPASPHAVPATPPFQRSAIALLIASFASAAACAAEAEDTAREVAALAPAAADPRAAQPVTDRIVVTARNREELAQDVPLPVLVIGGAQLERDGVKSVWDLTGKAPNLQLNPPGENARKVSVSIRGIGRNGANDSAEGSVGVIVDGVPLYYAGQAWSDYVDLERIEVLRGPQGTLIGKNTTLGAINIVTKAPNFHAAQSFELDAGSFNDIAGRFSTTGPLVDGQLAYRATVVVDRANGVYTNTYQSFGRAKETWNETNRVAGRFQLLWTPNGEFSARVTADKLRSDERTNLSFQWDNGPATWSDGVARTAYTPPAGYGGSYVGWGYLGKFTQRSAWFHNSDLSVYQPRLGSTDFGNSEARPQVTDQHGLAADLRWDVAGHTLTSISAYRYQDFDIKNGGNYDQFFIGSSGQQLWNKQLSQELRLASEPGKTLDYQVGVYYLDARVYSDDPSYYGPDAGAWNASNSQFNTLIATASGRELLRASLDGIYQSSVTDAHARSGAAYGQADWHVASDTTLTGGLRQTHENKTNRISQQLDRPGIALTAANFASASAAELSAANAVRTAQVLVPYDFIVGEPISSNLTAWNLSPSWKPNRETLLYASAGRGVKTGLVTWKSTALSGGVLTPQNILPETSLDFELGVKGSLLADTLQINLNAYRTKVSDYQTQVSVLQSDGLTYKSQWTNAPGVLAHGIEFETVYRGITGLALSANGAYNRAAYDGEFLVAKPEVDTSLPQYAGRAGLVDLNGRQLYNAPKVSINLGADYVQPLGSYLLRLTASNSYRSGAFQAVNQAAGAWQPAYSLTDVSLGLGDVGKHWEVSLVGRNVFDTFYAVSRATYSATAAATLQQGAGRYLGVAFRSKSF